MRLGVWIRSASTIAALAMMWSLGGCGVYSASSGRVDQSIQRVAVEYLENRTAEPDLGITLADLLIVALQEDNTLKVVDYESADSVIEGSVIRYALRQASISQEQQVDEYQVQIAVELTFRVKATGETVFQRKRFAGTGNYLLGEGSANELTAREEAMAEITRDVLAEVVEDW
jgi:hypothetical protein